MAAVALQDTTLQQLEKIIEVVGQKSVSLVEGIKTSVAPKLNETIAQVIDDFKSGGLVKQNKAIEKPNIFNTQPNKTIENQMKTSFFQRYLLDALALLLLKKL